MTTNIELLDIIKKLNIGNFRGIYCSDELTFSKTENECMIINFDTSFSNGTHWVACYVRDNVNYYFDSYGSPIPKFIKKYLNGPIYTHDFQLQSFNKEDNELCGQYCIIFLYLMDKGFSYQNVVSLLAID